MSAGVEFLLGLLEQDAPAHVAWEDLEGENGNLLRACQEAGFLGREPRLHPVPSCPHCGEGVPYRLEGRYVCNACHTRVNPRHLAVWQLDREGFMRWLAGRMRLRGGVRRLGERFWQLGTWDAEGGPLECFYTLGGSLSEIGETRLAAYRNALVLYGLARPAAADRLRCRCASLLELLRLGTSLNIADLQLVLRERGNVRFDTGSGALWVGETWLGEVPLGSKEFFFLDCLAAHLDHFVAYADLKYAVLRQAGSRDTTEEATFCQGLKSRIKKKWIAKIDRLLVTTNKGDGYRLRGYAEV